MTKGKVVNKQTGLEITGFLTNQLDRYFWFTIDGDDDNIRSFDNNSWDFIEDRARISDQMYALPIGEKFTTNFWKDSGYYVRVSDSHVAYISYGNPASNKIMNIDNHQSYGKVEIL
jgi:hypothetical protein